jgi:hypothetical protein
MMFQNDLGTMTTMETLFEKLYRTTNLVIRNMETSWLYCVDFPLHHAEVHLSKGYGLIL